MVQLQAQFGTLPLHYLQVVSEHFRIASEGTIIEVEQGQLRLQLRAKLMDGQAEKEGTEGITLLHPLCGLKDPIPPKQRRWRGVSRVNKAEKSRGQSLHGFQHLVPADRVECILEVQLQDGVARVKTMEVELCSMDCRLSALLHSISQLPGGQQGTHFLHHPPPCYLRH